MKKSVVHYFCPHYSQAKFPDWSKREDIKSSLKVGLILLLDKHGYSQQYPTS